MANRLENQVAWISGASSGMGEAIARLFAQEGASVALIDVQAEKGEAIAADIRPMEARRSLSNATFARNAVCESIERTVANWADCTSWLTAPASCR